MRITIFLAVVVLLLTPGCAEPPADDAPRETPTVDGGGYDSLLAVRLGADDYGMGRYVMALLKAGPNRDQDSTETARVQKAHLDNITRLAKEGTLVLAGPFLDEGDLKGIYVFDVESVAEARALTETDPAVQAGRLVMELHPWYGSAALRDMSDVHARISKATP